MAPNCVLAGRIQLCLVRSLSHLKGDCATCPEMQRALVRRCFVANLGFGRVALRMLHQIQQKLQKYSENKENELLTCVSLKGPMSLAFVVCPDID